jgi:hypothetical protein
VVPLRAGDVFGRPLDIQIANLDVGVLFIFAITALGVYGIVSTGYASNNKCADRRPGVRPDVLLRTGPRCPGVGDHGRRIVQSTDIVATTESDLALDDPQSPASST